ncbi:DUF4097 family beta strand repeat-containing protein [Anaerorhabdus furcosa]|uniref:DUF4097 domain-containing protein n=1 Tax=Anaerorhabdus furcosa TaxID=118967 RepID=A0A1T4PEN0_9FIRM|nr:DUF4097 family beta strand repeat-containing protein [Anaerorhabdus furcosa]SJZ90033.1 hypothetical protein SAMN02745191_1979 [Anaerorhabdus furcosa]
MKINENYFNIKKIKAKMIEEDIVINYYEGESVCLKYDGDYNNKISIVVNGDELIVERKLSIETLVCIKISKGILQLFIPKSDNMDMKLKSTSGHIQVFVDAMNLELETVSGRIESHGVGKRLSLHTVSGSIRQYKPYDKLEFKTTSGSVKLAGKPNCEYVGSTISGGVLISLNDNQGYILKFKSVSGRFRDKYNTAKIVGSGEYTQGSAHSKFNINTISGNCKLDNWA